MPKEKRVKLPPNGLILLQKAAEEGNQYAQCDLGTIYAFGEGVPKDEAKAAEWYQKAAIQGNKFAQFELGVLYEFGRGVYMDKNKAAEWYQKAAAQGWSRDVGQKSISNKEEPYLSKTTNSGVSPSGKETLLSVIAIAAIFLLVAFLGKNYNKELFTFINAALVIGLIYALIKHTRGTLAVIAIILFVAASGSVVKGCSSHNNYEYEPGPGFR